MQKEKKEKKATDPRVSSIHGFYSAVFLKTFGFKPTIRYVVTGSSLKRLLKDFNEWQINVMILVHFNWRGMDGTDEWGYNKLKDKAFPLEWLGNNVNSYQAYARNVLGLDFDNEVSLQEYVHNYIKSL